MWFWPTGLRAPFPARDLQRYLALQALVFWGLILLAWLTYPAENRYSIRTHTFSFLGSPNPEHHPQFWGIFSAAMVFWALSELPVLCHLRQRFARLSRPTAALATACLFVGCVGLLLVGWFPDARTSVWPGISYSRVHTQAALLVAAGCGAGMVFYWWLWVVGWVRSVARGIDRGFPLRRAGWPLSCWLVVSGICVFMVLHWEQRYAALRGAARAAGRSIGSSWAEGLKTWYAFPLWENLAIYTLYIGMAWLAWALAAEAD